MKLMLLQGADMPQMQEVAVCTQEIVGFMVALFLDMTIIENAITRRRSTRDGDSWHNSAITVCGTTDRSLGMVIVDCLADAWS